MQKVKFLRPCGAFRAGEIAEVGNNDAFGLIDGKWAELYREKPPNVYMSKEMRPFGKKKYRTK